MNSRLPRPDDRVALGRSGLEVSPICLGIAGSPEVVETAFDAGVNFFFVSCDMHWPIYAELRDGIAALLARPGVSRDQIVVAGASYLTQPEFCRAPFVELVDAVPGLERLDVLVAGGAYGGELERRSEVYRQSRAEGLAGARGLGTSFHDRGAALAAIQEDALDVAFVRYSPLHPGARDDLFPALDDGSRRACRVYNFNSTRGQQLTGSVPDNAGDMWIPRVPDYYRFALSRPQVDGLLCAFTRPGEIAELVAALDEGPLSAEEEDYMIALVAEIKRERDALLSAT